MDATDAQFQRFVQVAGIPVNENGIPEWSFDDRCRVINHALKYGVKLPFVDLTQPTNEVFNAVFPLKELSEPNEKSSESEQKQLPNNSETIRNGELFEGHEQTSQATSSTPKTDSTDTINGVVNLFLG